MILIRAVIVIVLLFGFAAVKRVYGSWRRRVPNDTPPTPRMPTELVGGADRTWVVFTTPDCASCGPVKDSLRAHDVHAAVIDIDATREPLLAKAFRIKAAPTALLADRSGEVHTRLVGLEAVQGFVDR